MKQESVKERYLAIKRSAEHWAKAGNPETAAGPCWWGDFDNATCVALGTNSIGGELSERERQFHDPKSPASAAVRAAFNEVHQQIWARAAEIMFERASALKDDLVKESAEIAALAASLDEP